MNEAFSLAMSASDRFGLNAVLAGHIALVNKLVEIEDYTRVAEGRHIDKMLCVEVWWISD